MIGGKEVTKTVEGMGVTHASLFSGIGSVDLAAHQLGIRNIFNCEINPFCRQVLDYWFPESIGYKDITKVDFTNHHGQVTILSGGFPCFVAGTPVLTGRGFVPIEKVMVGDMVLSADREYHEVEATMSHEADEIAVLWVEGMAEPVRCTPNHKFLVKRLVPVWVPAMEFHRGEQLSYMLGEPCWKTLESVKVKMEKNIVYNLSVKDEHSYNVYGIAVHNCQPFSLAGQRRGTSDDRFLWPQMLRAIREIQPAYVLGENVPGILTDVQPGSEVEVAAEATLFGENHYTSERGQFVVERICQDLEREGYSVIPLVLPACAVGAPHRRDRVWFVAKQVDADPVHGRDSFPCGGGKEEAVHEGRAFEAGHAERPAPHADGDGHRPSEEGGGVEGHGGDIVLQQGERRNTPERPDGLPALPWPAAHAERRRGLQGGVDVQPGLADGEGLAGDGMQRPPADAEGGQEGYDSRAKRKGHDCAMSYLESAVDYMTKDCRPTDTLGSPQLSPLFVEEMLGFPHGWILLPFLTQNGGQKPARPMGTPCRTTS